MLINNSVFNLHIKQREPIVVNKSLVVVILLGMVILGTYEMQAQEKITVSMSSVGWRKDSLKKVVYDLLPQVDCMNIFLQYYDSIPEFLNDPKITVAWGPDFPDALALGSCAKFFWAHEVHGYHVIVDDDIVYPRDYVAYCIQKIEDYKRRAVIGFHGSIFVNYLKPPKFRKIYPYLSSLAVDTWVHMLGTGVLAYHTDTLTISLHDFCVRNHADIYFALIARNQCVPLVCVHHEKGYILPIEEFARDPRALYKDPKAEEINFNIMQNNAPWTLLTIE